VLTVGEFVPLFTTDLVEV